MRHPPIVDEDPFNAGPNEAPEEQTENETHARESDDELSTESGTTSSKC